MAQFLQEHLLYLRNNNRLILLILQIHSKAHQKVKVNGSKNLVLSFRLYFAFWLVI